jgi:serine/threonine protein phosphatase PrpC
VVASRPPQIAARELVRLANERGGRDNVSVIVARWGPDE